MSLIEKTNHATEALSHLLQQYKGKDKIAALLNCFSAQIQEIESAFFELLNDRWMETSTGLQLDGLGQIVGEARQGRTDDDYRLALRVRILTNKSSGSTEQIIEILSLAIKSPIELVEYFPASFVTYITDSLDCIVDSGTHTGPNYSPTLTDSTKDWSPDSLIGKTIHNKDDYSMGVITANTYTTITATLFGGIGNDWNTGDSYDIISLPLGINSIIHDAKGAGINGQIVYYLSEDVFLWDTVDHGWDDGRWAGAL